MYYQSEPISCELFLDYLDKLPWCKQEENTLVAVHHCSPEVIDTFKHHDVKVYPGGLQIKLNKSTTHMLESKFEQGEAVPLLLVWKEAGIEMSFRTHKSSDFPYDTWENPAAAAYEREAILIESQELGQRVSNCFKKHLMSAKSCPSRIPKL
jgi:hypothetical protein